LANSARNLANYDLFPAPAVTLATAAFPLLRDQMTELDFLQMWLTEEFVREHWLEALKPTMAENHRRGAISTASTRHEVSECEAWLHFAWYFAHHVKMTNADFADAVDLMRETDHAMYEARRKTINAACCFSEDAITKMYEYFNNLAPQRVFAGTVVTIDETMIAYYGKDGKLVGIWRRIPEKPHQKGLIQYRAVMYLKHSHRRLIFCMRPTLPSRRETPSEAAIALARAIAPRSPGGLHVFLDSGFATHEVFCTLSNLDVTYTICVKAQFVGEFGSLVAAATDSLPVGQVRTFEYNNQIIQSISKPKDTDHSAPYVTSVVTTGYRAAGGDRVKHHVRIGTYENAISLYLKNDIGSLQKLDHHVHADTKRDFILAWTGWDPLAPAPDARGTQQFTREGLSNMDNTRLADLIGTLRGCRSASAMNKDQMVKVIAEHHPQIERYEHLAEKLTATAGDVLDLRSELGRDTSEFGLAIANYDKYKGAVDISNEDLYRHIILSHHGNYRRLLSFSVVHAMALNAWALYDEYVLERAHRRDPHITTDALQSLRCRFSDFILRAAHQLIVKYK
jgi:hypothetical protein